MNSDNFENEIQEWLDQGMKGPAPENADPAVQSDLPVYDLLFKALKEQTVTGPSYSFSGNVIRKIKTESEYKGRFIWNLLLPAGIILAAAVIYTMAAVSGNRAAVEAIAFLFLLKGPLIFALCCFFVIQYLDGRLIKKKYTC